MNQQETRHDYLIIGAGPAGLQLGYYMEKAGHDYLILEAGETPGTFFKRYPRHRKLISSNKIYTGYDDPEINLRFDWNSLLSDSEEMLFKRYSKEYFPPADDFTRYLDDYAKKFDLKIRYRAPVVRVSKDDSGFRVEDQDGNIYRALRLVVATGFAKPYIPQIPGIELAEKYTEVSVDPDDFANQKVLIIGKGNTGFETADNLIGTTAVIHLASPSPVSMAWKTHFVGHLRAVNNNFLDTYQLKSQNAVLDTTITKIERRDGKLAVSVSYTHASEEQEELLYDRVIVCTGWRFDASIFDESCRPDLVVNDRFPHLTSAWESANVKDLYIGGTLMQILDFKKTTSGFIHGFRYNMRALFHILESRYHGREWPSRAISATPEGLLDAALQRINRSSALWQQFGFLGDLIVVSAEDGSARYYEELPVGYIHDGEFGRHADYYVITLEFGKIEGDPFSIKRDPHPDRAAQSIFLHPIIRHFSGSELLSTHHLLEDLAGEWQKPDVHVSPLLEYFRTEVEGMTRNYGGQRAEAAGEVSSPSPTNRMV